MLAGVHRGELDLNLESSFAILLARDQRPHIFLRLDIHLPLSYTDYYKLDF